MVDPWGAVVAECSDGEGICTAEINLDYVQKIRQQMPQLSHKRSDIYGHIHVDTQGAIAITFLYISCYSCVLDESYEIKVTVLCPHQKVSFV